MEAAFYTLYQNLDREGPGEPADVVWAAEVCKLASDAHVCDAGCGSGGDVPALLSIVPEGRVTAIDLHAPFVNQIRSRFSEEPRLLATVGNMAELDGPFDLIWSAGALYFLGVTEGLNAWRPALAKGGAVAFSEPCRFTVNCGADALAFWEEYPAISDAAGIYTRVKAAGFETIATRRVSDAGWQNYYSSLQARINLLRERPDPALQRILDDSQREIDLWDGARKDSGYLLSVVQPA